MNNNNFREEQWSERWALLDKNMSYCFSLDVDYALNAYDELSLNRRLRLSANPAARRSTYHVLDDVAIRSADGTVTEVPNLEVLLGEDWIELSESDSGALSGSLVLRDPALEGDRVTLQYRGVTKLPPGFGNEKFFDAPVSELAVPAFISARHESSHPKFRWLVQTQLFGFGQLQFKRATPKTERSVQLSFDLYSGI